MDTPSLLSADERCRRISYWGKDWELAKIESKDLLLAGIREGLTSKRKDFNEAAGEKVIEIARDRELAIADKVDQYASIIHAASIADLVCMALRKPKDEPWRVPDPVEIGDGMEWSSSAFLAPSGDVLRRIVLVSAWSQDRHFHQCRTWDTLGTICAYEIPMQMIVIVLGAHREGKYHSAWSKGFRHPINKGLRFKRKNFIGHGFKGSWSEIYREDYDEISTADWLHQMIEDAVLPDICFRVDVPVPTEENRKMILDLARQKLKRIYSTETLPEASLSICDWPTRCDHAIHCHIGQNPSGRYGFVRIDNILHPS